ncbi:MAG: ASCH domain-containing protein [Patescibacteria group bacterium]|nr:ASCH domain-containing protein [Patescibacteria group bacterium]
MQSLKFAPHLVPLVLSGEKTSTWRLFDDKDLQVDDELVFVNAVTGDEFAKARITSLTVKTLGQVTPDDYDGHEKYSSPEEALETFNKFYGGKVTLETEVKIIKFELI